MSDDALPEPDRLDGAPHPRETARLVGQDAAEAQFCAALGSGRLPHGWLLAGPRGVGKATFAWRAARHLIATPPGAEAAAAGGLFGAAEVPAAPPGLDLDAAHPVAWRVRALSEPNLLLLRRGWDAEKKRLRTQITVDEVRRLKSFFALRSTEDARRVVIVDAADEMTPSAANALLKALEEPPRDAVLLLVAHQPSALLPTIRSRCRVLRFAPLDAPALAEALRGAGHAPPEGAEGTALALLAGGSVGAAVGLLAEGGVALYGAIAALLAGMPGMDRAAALQIADAAGARGAEARFELTLGLVDTALARLARAGATGALPGGAAVPGEAEMAARLAPDAGAARLWAGVAGEVTARARAGRAVNLDPAALLFDMFLDLDRAAARLPGAA